jgi:F-type H+-transporting ATPase subunit delta
MNDSKISVRYSRALFQSAVEKGILGKVDHDMKLILEVCRIPEVAGFLKSPIIVPSKKTEILHKLLGENVQDITLSLIDIVVKNGRERSLPAIARVFISETLKYNGVTDSLLTTAVKVDDEVRERIVSLIEEIFKTKISLNDSVDPDIIGGFVLRVGDNYVDASIRNKLRKIRKELKSGSVTAG